MGLARASERASEAAAPSGAPSVRRAALALPAREGGAASVLRPGGQTNPLHFRGGPRSQAHSFRELYTLPVAVR
jgi:hypothetical protein